MPAMGKRMVPKGPGRPKDKMPEPMRKGLGMNMTGAMKSAAGRARKPGLPVKPFGRGTKK